MSRADLLIELGCEELPARLVAGQAQALVDGIGRRLAEAGLLESAAGEWRATPRRLAVRFADVLARQPDRTLERKGPAVNVAFDADGNPTKAAEGFARSVGREVSELERMETDQGQWLFARIDEPGRSLSELLPEFLKQTVRDMAGARSMRWSDRDDRFLRPVRWLVVIHGGDVVPVELFGLESGRATRGHRVHAPGGHDIAAAGDYEAVLASAKVLVEPDKRRERIREQVQALADGAGLAVELDADLLDEVTQLTEWPVAVMGGFAQHFLEVPPEALIASMQHHQKCFPLRDADGGLAPRFIAVANIESTDPAAMTAGFERVIRPRLADAKFFWDADRRQPLESRRLHLKSVRFAEGLGSIDDKVRRLENLAANLAPALEADAEITRRAAALCKCDLVTEMVGEFPELQGIMGRHYALADGEPEAVAAAIESHYRPRHAGDALPEDAAGRALALADRLDTVTGVFAIGRKPTGGKDPFGLRRSALGIVRILEESDCAIGLEELVARAADGLAGVAEVTTETSDAVREFLMERLRSHAAEAGIEANTFHAVAAGSPGSVADFLARARAVQAFADDPEAASLIAANKRTGNLLRQTDARKIGEVDDKSLQDAEERTLYDALVDAESALEQHLAAADYGAALGRLAELKEPVDRFFDHVLVMAEDETLKANRLALLARLRAAFLRIADVARLGRGGSEDS